MDLYLGVDGGQSSTTAVVGTRDGKILGTGTAGPCNHARQGEGRTKLINALTEAISTALAPIELTLPNARFTSVCMGMSGGPDDKREIIRELVPADAYDITTDVHIALYGAVGDQPGAVVIGGTGSIALSRGSDGTIHRAGGWGYVFGDEGSAFGIAKQALAAALRFEEGWGPATGLHRALLDATGATSANDLLHRWYAGDFTRRETAAWSRIVAATADSGDPAAASILRDAGTTLAALAITALDLAAIATPAPIICPIGGVFGSPAVSTAFATTLMNRLKIGPTPAKLSPALGAFHAARQQLRLCGGDQSPEDLGT